MQVAQYIIGSVLILLTLGLVFVILKQQGKDKSLSGTITGGASDTFFGRSGGAGKDKLYARMTIIGSVLFVVLAIVLSILITIS